MSLIVEICVIVLTVIAVTVCIFLIITLLQIRRTAREVQNMACRMNNIMDFIGSPFGKIFGFLTKIATNFITKKSK